MKFSRWTLLLIVSCLYTGFIRAQQCLHTEDGINTAPPYDDVGDTPILPTGSLAIIETYKFRCCGEIEEWRTFITPGGESYRYNVSFQVWRPTSPELGNCYSLVGENKFARETPNGNSISPSSIRSAERVTFQRGDVVGFHVIGVSRDQIVNGGLQLETSDRSYASDVVWYQTFPVSALASGIPNSGCPFCIGEGQLLPTSTTAAPIFSAVLETNNCNIQPTLTTLPSTCATSSSQIATSTLEATTVLIEPASSSVAQEEIDGMTSLSSELTVVPQNTNTQQFVISKTITLPVSMSRAVKEGPVETPIHSSSTEVLQTAVVEARDLITELSQGFESSDMSERAWTVVSVVAALLVLLAVVAVVVVLVLVPKNSICQSKPHNIIGNPTYLDKIVEDHTYQTVDDDHGNAAKMPNYSEPCDSKVTAGVYSLYSAPDIPDAQYSVIQEPLNEYDLEHGYHIIGTAGNYTVINDKQSKPTEASVDNYATATSVSKVPRPSLTDYAGVVVPNQEQRKSSKETGEKDYSKLTFFNNEPIYWAPAKSSEELYDQLSSRNYREIPRKQIKTLQYLGSGQSGSVSKGLWEICGKSLPVAIKKLRPSASSTNRIRLLQEAAIMGQFHHSNIVQLCGLMTIGEPLAMCTEFMKNGDLENYLTEFNVKRDSPPNSYSDIQYFFVKAAADIASGMAYLSSKAFIHRDLATRNILMDDTMTCKIGDFGMARDLMDETYYTCTDRRAIPVKWTAPEALFYKKYTTASDVWSYGMVLFEIWSVGKQPFPNTGNKEVVELLKSGDCQVPPPGCPKAFYQLMVDCWNPSHEKRPKFQEISIFLQQPVKQLLYWSPLEQEFASELGGKIELGENLYKDLQQKYNSSSNTANN